jgi:hypothetical protein
MKLIIGSSSSAPLDNWFSWPKNSVVNIRAFLEMPDLRLSTEFFRKWVKEDRFCMRVSKWNLLMTLSKLIASNYAFHYSGSPILMAISSAKNVLKSCLKRWDSSKSVSSSNYV